MSRQFFAVLLGVISLSVTTNSTTAIAEDGCPNGQFAIRTGFLKGEELVALPDVRLVDHVMGFVNGVAMATVLGANGSCAEQMYACVRGRSNVQLMAQTRKYLQDNPDRLQEPANGLLWGAIYSPCVTR
jgi:hypothetical protein